MEVWKKEISKKKKVICFNFNLETFLSFMMPLSKNFLTLELILQSLIILGNLLCFKLILLGVIQW